MDDARDDERRAALIRREYELGGIEDLTDELYHPDAVLDFPQSGERFEGVANFREWRSQYPGDVRLHLRELRGGGDVWVSEGSVTYDDGPPQPAVGIHEFRGDKMIRETLYIAEPWEAPEWRARWRAAP